MKKHLITIAILLIGYMGLSQDLKFKKDLVLIDGKESLKVDGNRSQQCFHIRPWVVTKSFF